MSVDLLKQPASQLLPSEVVRSKFNCDLLPAYASSGCKSKTEPICPQGCVQSSSKGQSKRGEEEEFRVGRSIVIPGDDWSLSSLGWVPGESQLNSPPSWFPPIAKNQHITHLDLQLPWLPAKHYATVMCSLLPLIPKSPIPGSWDTTCTLYYIDFHPGLVVWSVSLLGLCLFIYQYVHISETGPETVSIILE